MIVGREHSEKIKISQKINQRKISPKRINVNLYRFINYDEIKTFKILNNFN